MNGAADPLYPSVALCEGVCSSEGVFFDLLYRFIVFEGKFLKTKMVEARGVEPLS